LLKYQQWIDISGKEFEPLNQVVHIFSDRDDRDYSTLNGGENYFRHSNSK